MLRSLNASRCFRAIQRSLSSKIPEPKIEADHLKGFIRDRIRTSGPITVFEYMGLATRSAAGYYSQRETNKPIFGEKGDFVTSPELTQAFGEIIGVWIYNELLNCGYSSSWQLVELGPGTGKLTSDVLRTINTLSKVRKKDGIHDEKLSIHLVEISDLLIDAQERELCGSTSSQIKDQDYVRKNKTKSGLPVFWHKYVDTVPKKFTIFIANEFFDALPIHMFERSDSVWREVYVNLNENNDFCFMLSKNENLHTAGLIPTWIREDQQRTKWEVSPEAGALVTDIAQRITQFGGFGLFVDYGHKGDRTTTSLRAYQNHQLVDPLSMPGTFDLTADVDFGYWQRILKDICLTYGPIEQRYFLAQMGIRLRIERLLQQTPDLEQRKQILSAYSILTSDKKGDMGMAFKFFSIFPNTLANIIKMRGGFPAGFWPVSDEDENEKIEIESE